MRANASFLPFLLAQNSCSDRFLVVGAHFRHLQEGQWSMAGRPSRVTQAVLTDDTGAEVFEGNYSSRDSAQASASQWVRKHYQVETQEVPAARPSPKPRPRSLAGGPDGQT